VGIPDGFSRFLNNLISNAVKFTDIGEVRIDVDIIEKRDDSVKLKFTVSDTGIGIDGDKMNMLLKVSARLTAPLPEIWRYRLGTCNFKTACRDDGWRNLGRESKGKGSTFYFTAGFKRKAKSSVKAECTSNADERVLGGNSTFFLPKMTRSISRL